MYQAIVTSEQGETETYVGLTDTSFKTRLANHKQSLRKESLKNQTELSKNAQELKNRGKTFNITWRILGRSRSYSNPIQLSTIVMAVGRLLLGCAISLLILRLLMLFGQPNVNLNHVSKVSSYLWRFCKINDSVRPCSTHFIRAAETSVNQLDSRPVYFFFAETLRFSQVQAVRQGTRTYPTALFSSVHEFEK